MPHDALNTRPAWEIDLLSRGLAQELGGSPIESPAPRRRRKADPFAVAPDLERLL